MSALLLGLLLTVSPAAPAEQWPLLTLDQALAQAKQGNLELKIAQQRLDQAHLLSRKVWSAYLPQLSVGAQYTRNNVDAQIGLPTGYYVRDVCVPPAGTPAAQQDAYRSACAAQVGGPPNDPSQPSSLDNPPGAPTGNVLIPSSFQSVTIQKLNQLGAAVTLNQAIIAPALWPAISNAYLAEKTAELNVEGARRELLFAVAQTYYGAAALKEALRVQQQQLEMNRQHEQDAKVRYQSGAVQKAGLLRAEIDRSRSEQDVRRAQLAFEATRVVLSTLLDRDTHFSVEFPPEAEVPADLASLEDAAVKERPDVQAARSGISLAEGTRTGVLMQYLPNIGFSARYQVANVTGFTGKYDSWSLGLGLQWNLFDGLGRETQLAEASSKLVEAKLTLQQKERSARDEVTRAKLDLQSAIANREKAAEQLRLARENVQLVDVGYQSGAVTYLELEDAKTQLLGAEIGNLSEQLNASLAVLKVLKAAGRFNP